MPSAAEKVAQVEAAMQSRFFPFVQKVVTDNRRTWTDANHYDDRLSRALAAYAIVWEADVDTVAAVGAIVDGGDDGGIDAIYFDRARNRLLVVQAKFKRGGNSPNQPDNIKSMNGIKMLLTRRFDEFNTQVQSRRDEIEEALDTAGIVIELLHAYLGDNFSDHVKNDLDALKVELNKFSEQFRWQQVPLSKLYDNLMAEQAPASVCDQITLAHYAEVITPRKAIYGQISAAALAKLVAKHGKALFERNIRHYLGSVGVNAAITDSVKRKPDEFFYLNNGITAVAEKIEPAAGGGTKRTYHLTNVSIVNGAQTAGAIAVAEEVPSSASLLITVIEIGGAGDDLGFRITRARNHQNAVRGIDFAALDPNQERLRQELAIGGITYFYRPSAEARTRRDDACTIEEAAIALACLSWKVLNSAQVAQLPRGKPNAVDYVVAAKKEIGRLWDQDGVIYKRLFTETLSGRRMCRLVRVYRFIDAILAGSEGVQPTQSAERLFYRHGRYFIMAFVSHRLSELVIGKDITLSEGDRTALSVAVNELSELILQRSKKFTVWKGYLSVFRNLTDAQQLADSVLDALREQDARKQSPAPAAAADTSMTTTATTGAPTGQQGNVQ